ncbi:MAG: hypothetical protein E6R00_04870 [Gammaproteobacteria bacterium]|nr:MAG: hypothetical protein E6R00_04870 [Gammaproteobacteria bacterium]
MSFMIKLAALAAAGYAGFRYLSGKKSHSGQPAFASGETDKENFSQVRDAGPTAMRDKPKREWTTADQQSDESFPASDPPGNY